MKGKELDKTAETDVSQKEKQPENTGQPARMEIVIPDECGDSLWDPVLAQERMKDLLALRIDEKNKQPNGGKTPENKEH